MSEPGQRALAQLQQATKTDQGESGVLYDVKLGPDEFEAAMDAVRLRIAAGKAAVTPDADAIKALAVNVTAEVESRLNARDERRIARDRWLFVLVPVLLAGAGVLVQRVTSDAINNSEKATLAVVRAEVGDAVAKSRSNLESELTRELNDLVTLRALQILPPFKLEIEKSLPSLIRLEVSEAISNGLGSERLYQSLLYAVIAVDRSESFSAGQRDTIMETLRQIAGSLNRSDITRRADFPLLLETAIDNFIVSAQVAEVDEIVTLFPAIAENTPGIVLSLSEFYAEKLLGSLGEIDPDSAEAVRFELFNARAEQVGLKGSSLGFRMLVAWRMGPVRSERLDEMWQAARELAPDADTSHLSIASAGPWDEHEMLCATLLISSEPEFLGSHYSPENVRQANTARALLDEYELELGRLLVVIGPSKVDQIVLSQIEQLVEQHDVAVAFRVMLSLTDRVRGALEAAGADQEFFDQVQFFEAVKQMSELEPPFG